MARPLRRTVIALAIVAGLLILVVALFDWNWLKGPIAWAVSQKTGRQFAIDGDLRVDLSARPRITADGVRLGNAAWGSEPDMLKIERLSLRVDLRELLRRRLVLPELVLSGPRLLLETGAAGERNWDLGRSPEARAPADSAALPAIGAVRIDDGALVYRDPSNGTDLEVAVSTPVQAPPEAQSLRARVRGRLGGRDVAVQRVESDLSRKPRIVAEGVVVGNAPWGSRPAMADIGRVVIRVDVAGLLNGRLALPELVLARPDILLEKTPDGRANWTLGGGKAQGAPPRIGVLRVEDGTLRYRDPQRDVDLRFRVATVEPRSPEAQPMMAVQGDGRYKGARFEARGRLGTVLSLHDVARPYPVDLRVRVGRTRAALQGTLTAPMELRGFNLAFELEGEDLSELYPFIPVPLPETPPYRLVGRLDHEGARWTFTGFQGQVGDSDLAGDFAVDLGGPRPALRGDLVSRNLDFDDLAGLVGAAPDPAGTASPEQRRRAAEQARRDRALPDRPYELERLRAVDADVRFRGKRLISQGLPLENLTAHLLLEDGRLTLRPLDFGVAGGRILTSLTMDAGREPIAATAEIAVQNLDLQRLFPAFRPNQSSAGRIGGSARLAARGNSVAEMLGSANGDLALTMSGGQLSNLLLELADLDVAQSLLIWLTGDRSAPVRCLVADFHAEDGVLTARTFVLDTTVTTITGEGTIDFRDELLDLRLTPRAKGPSLLVLRGPILVTGRIRQPAVRPDVGRLTMRAGVAAVLGLVLGPPGALLPLVQLGLARDADCPQLVARAEARVMPGS